MDRPDVPELSADHVHQLIARLNADGFFLEGDVTYNLGVSRTHHSIERALKEAGWNGSLIFTQTENGGEWTCYAYDVTQLEPKEAERAALRRWHDADHRRMKRN